MNWGNRRETDKDLSLWIDVDSKQIYIWNKCLWPTYQISLTYLKKQKGSGPDTVVWEEQHEKEFKVKQYVEGETTTIVRQFWPWEFFFVDFDTLNTLILQFKMYLL